MFKHGDQLVVCLNYWDLSLNLNLGSRTDPRYACFYKVDVLEIRALLFGVYIRARSSGISQFMLPRRLIGCHEPYPWSFQVSTTRDL